MGPRKMFGPRAPQSLNPALPVVHILNKVFALIARFVTAVGNSNSYELTGLFFLNYCPFGVVK